MVIQFLSQVGTTVFLNKELSIGSLRGYAHVVVMLLDSLSSTCGSDL